MHIPCAARTGYKRVEAFRCITQRKALPYWKSVLLDFNFCSCFFKLGFQSVCFVFGNTLLERRRSLINGILGFFQSKAGKVFHEFHYGEFIGACFGQHYVKCCFFLNSGSTATTGCSSHSYCSSSGLNAVVIFQDFGELIDFLNGEVYEAFCHCFQISHFYVFFKRLN